MNFFFRLDKCQNIYTKMCYCKFSELKCCSHLFIAYRFAQSNSQPYSKITFYSTDTMYGQNKILDSASLCPHIIRNNHNFPALVLNAIKCYSTVVNNAFSTNHEFLVYRYKYQRILKIMFLKKLAAFTGYALNVPKITKSFLLKISFSAHSYSTHL